MTFELLDLWRLGTSLDSDIMWYPSISCQFKASSGLPTRQCFDCNLVFYSFLPKQDLLPIRYLSPPSRKHRLQETHPWLRRWLHRSRDFCNIEHCAGLLGFGQASWLKSPRERDGIETKQVLEDSFVDNGWNWQSFAWVARHGSSCSASHLEISIHPCKLLQFSFSSLEDRLSTDWRKLSQYDLGSWHSASTSLRSIGTSLSPSTSVPGLWNFLKRSRLLSISRSTSNLIVLAALT